MGKWVVERVVLKKGDIKYAVRKIFRKKKYGGFRNSKARSTDGHANEKSMRKFRSH